METENDQLGLTTAEKNVVLKNFFPPNASSADMAFCMGVANKFGLNPLLNQIYFVERKQKIDNNWITKVAPMVGRDGFLTIAHKSGQFDGIETTTEIKKVPFLDGDQWEEKTDLVAICKVYRKDTERAFIVEVSFNEYAGRKNSGELTKFWKEKGVTMLMKVSESQCLRKAFNVSGVYAEEELNDVNIVPSSEAEPKQLKQPEHDDVNAELTEGMAGQSVNIVSGEVTEEGIDHAEYERPAYMEDTPKQATFELDIDED